MYKHVLVPIAMDHSATTGEAVKIAQSLLADGGKLTALNVMEPIPNYVSQYLPQDQTKKNIAAIETSLTADLGGIQSANVDVVTGHAGGTIVDYARENDVDCIVIASHKPGLQDFFLGSTAARVVRHAPCAVHVVR